MDCKIEGVCPYSIKCKIKNIAEFCAYHRANEPSQQKCHVFPDCFYISICNVEVQSKYCKNLSCPPPHPLPTPNSFLPLQ
jgi:hypothetical protein